MSSIVDEIKSVGHIDKLHIDISSPIPMKMQDLEIKNLNILVGANGVGKSFILVVGWVFSHLASIISASEKLGLSLNFEEICQFTFDTSFRSKNITGTLACTFQSGANITCILVDGKVKASSYTGFEGMTQVSPATFMSSAMRRFDSMARYLQMRKMVMNSPEVLALHKALQSEIIIMKMIENYPLYDVLYVEGLIARLPKQISVQELARLKSLGIEENIIEYGVDLDHCDFYVVLSSTRAKLYISTWFGSGHQALLNMSMAQII